MQSRSEETRTHLLEAALKCFAVHGYNAASIDQICSEAGVSKGAFYHHFESKQGMFMALLESWLADLEQALSPIAAAAPSIPEALIKMAQAAQIFAHGASEFRKPRPDGAGRPRADSARARRFDIPQNRYIM